MNKELIDNCIDTIINEIKSAKGDIAQNAKYEQAARLREYCNEIANRIVTGLNVPLSKLNEKVNS